MQRATQLCLIAGAGRLPAEAAHCLGARGHEPIGIAFEGLTDPSIASAVAELRWHRLGQLEALVRDLRELGIDRLLMVGKVPKSALFGASAMVELDARATELIRGASDLGDETLMSILCGWLEEQGFEILGQDAVLTELLVAPGVLGRRAPDGGESADLAFGRPIARRLGEVGIGQCVVVRDRAVLAVEAMEGTDETIRRAGRLGGEGATVIKMARPGQDRRLDLPAVGPETIRVMQEAGARALALEAGSCLVLEREETIAAADRAGIALWSFERESDAR